jgi:hypothetical protein
VAFVRDGTNQMKLYANGSVVATGACSYNTKPELERLNRLLNLMLRKYQAW